MRIDDDEAADLDKEMDEDDDGEYYHCIMITRKSDE